MEHKQIPRVQWHTPHFCPLLDVTNTRGGRAKGRPLSDLVIQNFSNTLSAMWDYSRLPMRWVRNTEHEAKWLPRKPRWGKKKIQPPAHPYWDLRACLSGDIHLSILTCYLAALQPYHWERFCQVQGGKSSSQCQKFGAAKTSSSLNLFHSFVHNRGHTPGTSHLYPIPQCKLQDGLCWAALAFSKHNLTKCIPPSTILPAASTSIKLPSL